MRNNSEKGWPRGFVANVLDSDIVVGEFELQSRYNIHFLTTLGKVRTLLPHPSAIG